MVLSQVRLAYGLVLIYDITHSFRDVCGFVNLFARDTESQLVRNDVRIPGVASVLRIHLVLFWEIVVQTCPPRGLFYHKVMNLSTGA